MGATIKRMGYQAATGALLTVTSSLHCARGMKAHLLGNNPILLTIFPNFPHNFGFFQSSFFVGNIQAAADGGTAC